MYKQLQAALDSFTHRKRTTSKEGNIQIDRSILDYNPAVINCALKDKGKCRHRCHIYEYTAHRALVP